MSGRAESIIATAAPTVDGPARPASISRASYGRSPISRASASPSGHGRFTHPSSGGRGPRPAAIAGPARRPAPTASPSGPGSGKPGAFSPDGHRRSDLPGVADLHEKRPVRPGDADSARSERAVEDAAHRIVRVAQEEDRPRVELVREQELGEDVPGLGIDRKGVHGRVLFEVLVLDDGPDEGPDAEVPDELGLAQVGRVDRVAAEEEPLVGVTEDHVEMPEQAV